MSKYKSKYFISLVIGIILLFILSICIVFLFKGKNNNTVDSDMVSFYSETNTAIIKNILPTTDEFGKTISDDNGGSFIYLDFSVENNCDKKQNFQIYLTQQFNELASINDGYVKFYLTDDKDVAFPSFEKNAIPSYVDLEYIKDKADSKNLYKGTLKAFEEKKFRLRVWIADSYVISDEEEAFSFEIGARAI